MIPRPRSRGFTLIEAMVALVVFSMAAIGIYGWINGNLVRLNRIAEVAMAEQVVNASVERLKLVDLANEVRGSFKVNSCVVDWKAELVEPWKSGVSVTGALGDYDVALFDIILEITYPSGNNGTYSYRRAAYKQLRDLTGEKKSEAE
jgi:general secretion pathway protein I